MAPGDSSRTSGVALAWIHKCERVTHGGAAHRTPPLVALAWIRGGGSDGRPQAGGSPAVIGVSHPPHHTHTHTKSQTRGGERGILDTACAHTRSADG